MPHTTPPSFRLGGGAGPRRAPPAAGWHACLDVLEYEVDGRAAPWTPTERWSDVHDGYVDEFPSEASTIGPPSG